MQVFYCFPIGLSFLVCKGSTLWINGDSYWAARWVLCHLYWAVQLSIFFLCSAGLWETDRDPTQVTSSSSSSERKNSLAETGKCSCFLMLPLLGLLLDAAAQVGILLVRDLILPIPPLRRRWQLAGPWHDVYLGCNDCKVAQMGGGSNEKNGILGNNVQNLLVMKELLPDMCKVQQSLLFREVTKGLASNRTLSFLLCELRGRACWNLKRIYIASVSS